MLLAVAGLLLWDFRLQQDGARVVGLPLGAVAALLLGVGYFELARLAAGANVPVLRGCGLVLTLAVGLLPIWRQLLTGGQMGADLALMVLAGVVALTFLCQMACHRIDQAIRRMAGTLLAVAYLGVLGACLLAIRVRFGVPALVLFLAGVKFADIGAYFVGSWIGRHKLIPWLSPGKSWEGLAGGLATSAIVTMLLNWLLAGPGKPIMSIGSACVLGLALGAVGQFGDLCESLLKRDAKVKDSGALVPRFGGVLDIVDSPLVAAPVGYLLLALLR
jgi:phosphatidate cytidylyltransferase